MTAAYDCTEAMFVHFKGMRTQQRSLPVQQLVMLLPLACNDKKEHKVYLLKATTLELRSSTKEMALFVAGLQLSSGLTKIPGPSKFEGEECDGCL